MKSKKKVIIHTDTQAKSLLDNIRDERADLIISEKNIKRSFVFTLPSSHRFLYRRVLF